MTGNYARSVVRYLRAKYDVQPRETRYGKHPALEFDYGGVARIVTINAPSNRDGGKLLALKLQDIRRQLGAPPPKIERRERMKLADMLPPDAADSLNARVMNAAPRPEPTPAPRPPITIRCASYKSGAMRIVLPTEVASRMFGSGGILLSRFGDNDWSLKPSSHPKPRFTPASSSQKDSQCDVRVHTAFLFGATECAAIETDGTLRFYLDPKSQRPPGARTKQPRERLTDSAADPGTAVAVAGAVDPAPGTVAVAPTVQIPAAETSPRERMLTILRELRSIEGLGTHRLAKVAGGRWEFRPIEETVRLEDTDL